MTLTNHKHDVSAMGMCLRKHTMLVHQSVVHITKHLSECWSTTDPNAQGFACHIDSNPTVLGVPPGHKD